MGSKFDDKNTVRITAIADLSNVVRFCRLRNTDYCTSPILSNHSCFAWWRPLIFDITKSRCWWKRYDVNLDVPSHFLTHESAAGSLDAMQVNVRCSAYWTTRDGDLACSSEIRQWSSSKSIVAIVDSCSQTLCPCWPSRPESQAFKHSLTLTLCCIFRSRFDCSTPSGSTQGEICPTSWFLVYLMPSARRT